MSNGRSATGQIYGLRRVLGIKSLWNALGSEARLYELLRIWITRCIILCETSLTTFSQGTILHSHGRRTRMSIYANAENMTEDKGHRNKFTTIFDP